MSAEGFRQRKSVAYVPSNGATTILVTALSLGRWSTAGRWMESAPAVMAGCRFVKATGQKCILWNGSKLSSKMPDGPIPILTHPVRFHGEKSRWMVPSNTQPNTPNLVEMDSEGGPNCSCEDWRFRHIKRGPNYQCRHIKMVVKEIAMLEEWTSREWQQ